MSYQFTNKEHEESGHEIIYTLDLEGNIKFINEAAERVSGYSCEEACRMNVAEIVAPELADYVRQNIREALTGAFAAVHEIEIIAKDGCRVRVETSAHLVTRDGEPLELRGIAFTSTMATQCARISTPRCLDERFTFGTVSYGINTLTIASLR